MYWSAIVFGLLGSFHCVGMCGPIVLAVPGKSIVSKLSYNFGRAITYSLMGGAIGLIGEGFSLAGYQQALSVIIGVSMLIIVIFTKYKHFDLPFIGIFDQLWKFAKRRLSPLFKSKSEAAPLIIGLINGLLPCGLVYAALFTATSMGGVAESAIYMALFGLGTAPLLIGVSLFGNFISPQIRNRFNSLVPYFLGIVAILLILRGLNLGIPFVSPKMNEPAKMENMHSKITDTPYQLNQGLFHYYFFRNRLAI